MAKRLEIRAGGRPRLLAGMVATLALAMGAAPASQPASAAVDPPVLGLPIVCTLGTDCWVVNLVDLDPGKGVRDFKCGKHSYDGHKGTDIAIADLAAMKRGVPVIASAAGVVAGVRDGMKDVDVSKAGAGSVKGRECGNGLVLSHPGGWETQYCHMRRGSVGVAKGDSIKAGQKLGLVGNSGLAQFPHIHLSVRQGRKVVDPFAGVGRKSQCGAGENSLWAKPLRAALGADETALYHAGFAANAPKPDAIRAGLHNAKTLSKGSPALVFWAEMFWVHEGDKLKLRLIAPDGSVIAENASVLPKQQARRFVFVGKKKKGLFWPKGRYRGEVTLTRGHEIDGRRTYKVTREIDIR